MTTGAIIVFIFAATVLWGGAAFCIYRAMSSSKRN